MFVCLYVPMFSAERLSSMDGGGNSQRWVSDSTSIKALFDNNILTFNRIVRFFLNRGTNE